MGDIERLADAADEGDAVDGEVVDGHAAAAGDALIGTVISDDRSPSFEEVRFRLEPHAAVSPGQFAVAVTERPGDAVFTLVRVLDVHETNPHEDALSSKTRSVLSFPTDYAHEETSTVIYRIARAEPVEEMTATADGVGDPREVSTLPRAGGVVLAAGPDVVSRALGMPADPQDGIHVGSLHTDRTVPIVLTPPTVQRHVLVVGGIGSGKSYTRGVLGEELHSLGVPQVNIDVNGEMVAAAEAMGGVNLVPGASESGFTLPLSALTREDLLEAVSGVNRGTNIETLIGYAFDDMQREVRQGRAERFGVADLVAHIERVAPRLKMEAAQTLRPAQQRTQALERMDFIGEPFAWADALTPGAFVNIDCRTRVLSDLRVITAAVARDIQSLARRRAIPFVVLSIDEFHLVAPNDDRNVSTQVLREIARIGRHYRIGLILTTQSPADVDRSILKRLLTRFIHAIEPDQLDALRGVFADAAPEVVRRLPKMPTGTCVLTGVSETVRHATVIDVRGRVTPHGGQTPDVWADLRERGWATKRPLGDIGGA